MARLAGPCLALTLVLGGNALAASYRLQSAALQGHDVPAGFGASHLKLFTHFASSMTISAAAGHIPMQSVCAIPTSFKSDGWQQGMVQAFDRTNRNWTLQLCASLFRTPQGAHAAYEELVTKNLLPTIKVNLAHKLALATVGDESSALQRAGKDCVCDLKPTIRTYEVVFRHGSAVVDLTYVGSMTFSAAQFRALASGSNSRLK